MKTCPQALSRRQNDVSHGSSDQIWGHHDDQFEAERFWNRYYRRLLSVARRKISHRNRSVFDAEDLVSETLQVFFKNYFSQSQSDQDYWPLLAAILNNRAAEISRYYYCQKRGGRFPHDSLFSDGSSRRAALLCVDQQTPEYFCEFKEQMQVFLESLQDESLREITILTIRGYSTEEIASSLGFSPRTVRRKMRLIRSARENLQD